jgi:hypothetical protein
MSKSRSKTREIPKRTLAVYPVADYPGHDVEVPEGTVSTYGSCAAFCANRGVPVAGAAVAEHSPWCGSAIIGHVDGLDNDGSSLTIWVDIAQLYTCGVYRRDELQAVNHLESQQFVRLFLSGDKVTPDEDEPEPGAKVLLSIGDTRRLISYLTHAVNAADHLLDDPNDARRERQGGVS